MKRAVIHKANGYWHVTVKDDDKIVARKIVGKVTDKAVDIMRDCVAHYGLAQVGVKASDIGSSTLLACISQGHGHILWMKPGWAA